MKGFRFTLGLVLSYALLSSVKATDNPKPSNGKKQRDNLPHDFSPIDENGIHILDENNFNNYIMSRVRCLVIFYAPWCGFCKEMMPEFEKASQLLKQHEHPLTIAKMDATLYPNIADKYEIQGYPTIKLFINSQNYDYTGQRTAEAIVAWVSKKSGHLLTFVNKAGHLRKSIEHNSHVVVLFYDKGDAKNNLQIFERAARQYPDYFYFGAHADVAREFGIEKLPDVVIYRNFDEPEVRLGNFLNYDNLITFLGDHMHPIVREFDLSLSDSLFSQQNPGLVLFYGDDEQSANAKTALNVAALDLKGQLNVITCDLQKDLGQRMADFLGIKKSDLPVFIILQFNDYEMTKYQLDATNVNSNDIVNFVDQSISGELTPHLNSQPVPDNDFEGYIRVLVGSNYNTVVNDPTLDVLVILYAPWCAQSASFLRISDEVAQNIKTSNPQILIAQMDATENEVKGLPMTGFPTILFYQTNQKSTPIAYDQERTEKALLQFLKQNTSGNWQQPKQTDL